jgi:hypothetical protein
MLPQLWCSDVLVGQPMTWLQKIVAVLFVVLWLPTTMHCTLEKLPGLQFLHCSSDTADNDCKDDGCCMLASGQYKVSDNTAVVPVPVVGFIYAVLVDVQSCREASGSALSRDLDGSGHLPQRWQFFQRTVAPARAPSLLS